MNRLFLVFFLFFSAQLSLGQTFVSSAHGDFDDNNIWVGGVAPDWTINAGETVTINHDIDYDQDITVEGTLIINSTGSLTGDNKKLEVEGGGKVVANGLLTTKELNIKDNNSRVEINDSIYVKNDAEVKDNGKLIINGNAFFDKKLTIEDADSVAFYGYTFIDAKLEVKDNSTLVSGPNALLTVDDEFKMEDGSSFISDGDLLIEKDFKVEDNATLTLNGTTRINDDFEPKDNSSVTFNGNAYIADDIKTEDNADIIIGSTSIVQLVDVIEHDGKNLTINGGLIAGGGGNTNESENEATINGTGLFQIDGDGIDNDGTIAGTLDVCSGDGSTNPVSGSSVSGGATVCSSAGANFPIIPAAPLPVDLVEFNASLDENNIVNLVWITASELNNDFFTVQRANEDDDFKTVLTIPGQGTTNLEQVYEITDSSNPCDGLCFYRIKQTDFDGKTTVYDAVSVMGENNEDDLNEVKLYPNPLINQNKVNIELPITEDQEVEFFVNDLMGRNYISDLTWINLGNKSLIIIQFDQKPPKGIYIISMIVNKEIISKKLYVE